MSNGDGVMQIGGYARRVDRDEFQHAAPAGLSGLARKTRKRVRRRCKTDRQIADQDSNNRNRREQTAVSKRSSKTATSHRMLSCCPRNSAQHRTESRQR